MNYRTLGKTEFEISEIGLGTWQVGGRWGEPFDHALADRILHAAVDRGVNFIDTADVYGDRQSEQAVGRLVRQRSERIYVATKCGRRLQPHTNEAYTVKSLRGFVEDSLRNMQLETIDLIQLHSAPNEVYYRPELFELFDRLKEEGKIRSLGVSVEKVEQALKAVEYDNVDSVQIIFNMFRHRPAETFFARAQERNVGIIVRVPLASGLLTGKFDQHTNFQPGDHRHDNRQGEQFDKGETFSGVDYETGLRAVNELADAFAELTLTQAALRWPLMFEAVSCVIPGASRVEQVASNVAVSDLRTLTPAEMQAVEEVYARHIRAAVHQRW